MNRKPQAFLAAALALVPLLAVSPGTAEATRAGACTWEQSTLPLPAGQTRGHVSAGATGGWFVGSGSSGEIRWHNGVAEYLGRAFDQQTELHDVNSVGSAVGSTYANSYEDDAVVYRDGAFSALSMPPGRRTARALAINDVGDIVGTASGFPGTVNLTLWPAAAPGTVLEINPDPAVYGYVVPVEIDEQGRILLRAEGSQQTDFFVRYPDGRMTKLALGTPYASAFRNGRIAGEKPVNGKYVTAEWDLTGSVVRLFGVLAKGPVVDSGTLLSGTYRTADKGYALGVWDNGVLTHTLVTSPSPGAFSRPVITDDGLIATTIGPAVTTFRRSCSESRAADGVNPR